ncbi:hypothetical protein H8I69_07410 [Serratia fonticola]|uniref:MrpH family fimbial adhesin n=1 Tax=Serratia fonticola TaxID=47917 RepID=UPI0015C5C6A5|nr:hypothetical protein [Serratia fonticola]MBC3378943.1 hypothetical protein [Serratia fonticola]NYA38143.1 hypothetical protein [Serratia fonticola]
MLNSLFFNLNVISRAACWLMAWSFLLHCFSAKAAPGDDGDGGVVPGIKVYYSYVDRDYGIFKIRGVEATGPIGNQKIMPCGFGTNKACVISFTCLVGSNWGPEGVVFDKPEATVQEVFNALQGFVGQHVTAFGSGACRNDATKMRILTSSSWLSAVTGKTESMGYRWGDSSLEEIPPEPDTDPHCKVNGGTGKVDINYGVVQSTDVSGTGRVRSAPLNLTCEQEVALKITTINELSLRSDLSSQLYFKRPGFAEVAGASGVITTVKNGVATIDVISKLKVTGTLQGGPFSGSTVIKLEYF